jgi:hypothetical protein
MTLLQSVQKSLKEVPADSKDAAARDLAIRYAKAIDANEYGDELKVLGPKLLSVLESFMLTPKARASVLKGAADNEPVNKPSPADELRARRAARKPGPSTVDSTAG